MKICFISTYLPQKCGIATYLSYLIDGIKKVNKEIKIKILAEKGAERIKTKNFEVLPCWSREENYPEQILMNLKDCDIVHIQHEYSIYKFDKRLKKLLNNIKRKIITIHCIRPAQNSERWDTDENFAFEIADISDHVIVHLESQKNILERKINSSKITVIPHGTRIINEDKIKSRKILNLPVDKFIILMFGFIKRHKNYEVVIDAIDLLKKEKNGIYFLIVGEIAKGQREYFERLKNYIKNKKLDKFVEIREGFFPEEYVPFLYSAVDLVIFPYYEGDRSSSGALHLAIGAGKIVLASRIPKFEELKKISDELLFLPFNSEEVKGLMKKILENKNFRDYLITRTLKYREETSWENTAKKHIEIYKKII